MYVYTYVAAMYLMCNCHFMINYCKSSLTRCSRNKLCRSLVATYYSKVALIYLMVHPLETCLGYISCWFWADEFVCKKPLLCYLLLIHKLHGNCTIRLNAVYVVAVFDQGVGYNRNLQLTMVAWQPNRRVPVYQTFNGTM